MSQTLLTSAIAENQALSQQMSVDAWVADEQTRGDKVALFRQYYDGEHRASLTDEMAAMLRIDTDNTLEQFNDNQCPRIIYSMTNRLEVTGITGVDDTANTWLEDMLKVNRFDGLQKRVHKATLRDAKTFLFVDWDNARQIPQLTHEPAYDGMTGVLVIYPDSRSPTPIAAIKLWAVTVDKPADSTRVNMYYPDRIEKYISESGGDLQRYEVEGEVWPAPWVMPDGSPIGVPLVPFVNRAETYTQDGKSELEDAVPLQDALNRTLYSMVMSSELTAFDVRFTYGFEIAGGFTPGMVQSVTDNGGPIANDKKIGIDQWQAADLNAYINVATWLKREIATVTDTPMPELGGSDAASGEALKQREAGLLGKLKGFHTDTGNSWEDALRMAGRIQEAFGTSKPPDLTDLNTQWRDPEVRADTDVARAIKEIAEFLDDRTILEELGKLRLFNWDAARIDEIFERKTSQKQDGIRANIDVLSGFPRFTDPFAPTAAGNGNNGDSGGLLNG